LLGPVLLGRLFDTVGRKPMIAGTYLGSAAVLTVLTIMFVGDSLGLWGFMALLLVTFFLASSGASSAYLTVSEIFPMETRALAIAFFYAIGTAVGGITGRSAGMAVSAPVPPFGLEREVAAIERALSEQGPRERGALARVVGARFWGPGRFPAALRLAVRSGRAQRVSRRRFGPGR
jgi:MFS family permease